MTDYKQLLERLKRNYKASIDHYDPISFSELAHTLRMWTEVKNGVEKLYKKPRFKKGIISKKVKRIINNSEYAYAYLPDGVTTSNIATKEVDKREMVHGPTKDKSSIATLIKIEDNGELTIAQFLMVHKILSPEEVRTLDNESKKVPIEKMVFSKYMESPSIYFQFPGDNPRNISNEQLIKRVANEYQGSHADSEDTNFETNNIFSNPVKKLMEYGCAKLPLPYFILLHIAKSIIENFEGKI